jgi:uncharacterized protein
MARHLYTNRLINEKSPYLLQHAHNPVDWYPWGEEAISAAKSSNKPIFLSIGYATCHWCHVMEQESFQNPEVAQLMNEIFVNVKVDREELPQIDSLYMEFAQAMMAGGAGWPLNVLLTPDLMPFFAATYLPAEANPGFLSMKQLLLRIKKMWNVSEERENIIAQAGKIVEVLAAHAHVQGQELPSKEKINEAAELLYKTADPVYGGTKGAPKFPVGIQACFLLRVVHANGDSRALFYIERSLEMMHRGGIYDHIGGGFSRYSVDERWLIPHFEKMLYDNALLARTYLEVWQYTKQNFYREVTEEILSYIMREMTHAEGGFYSAEDADTEGHEGKYYTWTWEEIHAQLGADASIFCDYYGVTPDGNFDGRSILHLAQNLEEFAHQRRLDPEVLRSIFQEMRKKLFEVRNKRVHPAKDDKIVTAWNGLMIHAFAEAGRLFGNQQYLDAAKKAATFIQTNLWREGRLLRRWREADPRFEGCLDDYAFMIQGLLTLFEADQGSEWLEFAFKLMQVLQLEFKAPHGAFYYAAAKEANLILRRCEFYDGAEPSGNAVHAENLLRLFQITGVTDFFEGSKEILQAAKEHIELYPPGVCYQLMALQRYYDKKMPAFCIALNEQEQHREEISQLLAQQFIPHKAIIWRRDSDEQLRDFSPLIRNRTAQDGKTTLYICYPDRCSEPITDLDQMRESIEKQ